MSKTELIIKKHLTKIMADGDVSALEQIESEMADIYESLANDEQGYRKLEAMRNFFQGLSSGQYLADMVAKIEEVQ